MLVKAMLDCSMPTSSLLNLVDHRTKDQMSVVIFSTGFLQELLGFLTARCNELLEWAPQLAFSADVDVIRLLLRDQLDELLAICRTAKIPAVLDAELDSNAARQLIDFVSQAAFAQLACGRWNIHLGGACCGLCRCGSHWLGYRGQHHPETVESSCSFCHRLQSWQHLQREPAGGFDMVGFIRVYSFSLFLGSSWSTASLTMNSPLGPSSVCCHSPPRYRIMLWS